MAGENVTHASADVAELSRRLAFFGLDAKACETLRALKPSIANELPKALETFYARALAEPELQKFFGSEAQIGRAKGAQVRHWDAISSGRFDGAFVANVRRVGQTHADLGLEPRWYIGGYALIVDHLVKALITERWPKSAFKRRGDAAAFAQAMGAMLKAAFLDMDLAISIYLDALEKKRLKVENEKRAVEAEATAALTETTTALERLAAKDLDAKLREDLPGRFAKLGSDFNAALSALRQSMSTVIEGATSIRVAANQIAAATDDLSRRSELQAANIEQSAAALEQVTATVGNSVSGAQNARDIASGVKSRTHQSGKVVAQAVEAMSRIEKSSDEIGRIIGVVDEIAFQTNLLALNAGVEAARAGDAGRGFAVVASEVRALAQRSAEAARDIKTLVGASTKEVDAGVKLVAESGAMLEEIVGGVDQIDRLIGQIAAGAEEQARALGEVNSAIAELDKTTQQNAAMAEETTAATATLTREAERLSSSVGAFRMAAAPPVPALRRARA